MSQSREGKERKTEYLDSEQEVLLLRHVAVCRQNAQGAFLRVLP